MIPSTLPRTSPEAQGVDSAALLRFVEALDTQIHEIHSVMVLRHGAVIAEGWWSPNQAAQPHLVFSLSKSFTATAIGLAVAEGYFSLDDVVISFFPDETPTVANPFLSDMTVRHLLSMSTGQLADTWSPMVDRLDGDWIRGFFDVPVQVAPGTHFVYNTGATYMLSAILQKATGQKLIDYLEPRLFRPLGIKDATWQESPQGITAGGIGLCVTTEDIAKLGQLYLQQGVWEGQQILPQSWVEAATALQISNAGHPNPDWGQGYGYQFWRCRHGAYRGDGVFGQYCIVMPEQDAVIAITGGVDIFDMQLPLTFVWELLLPAMRDAPLSPNADAQQRLQHTLAGLHHPVAAGAAESPVASQIAGRRYHVDENVLGVKSLIFRFVAGGFTVDIQTITADERIVCGYGHWQHGETGLFKQPLLFDRMPFVGNAAWISETSLTAVIRLYETPFFYTLECHFIGDELMIEVRVSVSLESLEPVLLTAHLA